MAIVGDRKQSIDVIKNTLSSIDSNLFIIKGENPKSMWDNHKNNYMKLIAYHEEIIETLKSILELYYIDNINNLFIKNSSDNIFLIISTNLIEYNNRLKNLTRPSSSPAFLTYYESCIQFLDLLNKDLLHLLLFSNVHILKGSDKFIETKNYLSKHFNNIQKRLEKVQQDLSQRENDTTEYLNRQGLCKSFQERATMLTLNSWIWLCIVFFIFITLASTAINHLSTILIPNDITTEQLDIIIKSQILYVPVAIIGFWALWFATKKHQYYSRLSDDYNYKNDISMAYYGYKNELLPEGKNSDPIRLKLLDNVLSIITKNPVESGMKTDTSPYTEIISKLLDQLKGKNEDATK